MRPRARLSLSLPLCAFIALHAYATLGSAQESMAGTWQAGATSMQVAIESWGKDCGPRPQSTQSAGGGRVQLEQRGSVVTIRGADRDLRSDQCWSPNPAMRKVSSSASGGVWTTRCKTAASDPRQEAGTYALRAQPPDKLQYQDISHFDWKLNESTCVATITTTQTLVRVAAAGTSRPPTAATSGKPAGKPAAKPASTPAPEAPACVPGSAARVVLRPRDADLELGQRLCFHARVLDAAGCPLEDAKPNLTLDHPAAIKAQLDGSCFQAGERSAEAEGTFKVMASYAGLRAEATVNVAAVVLPALLAKRLETGAVQGDDTTAAPAPDAAPPSPARAEATSRVAAKALAEPEPRGRRLLVALAALLAALAAGLLFLRARPRAGAKARTSSLTPSEVTRGSRTDCEPEPARARIRRCPTCGAGYPESSAFCGDDGSALSPPE